MKIGNIEIEKTAALAPMAGVADITFREICKSFGASYTETEMISSKGLTMGDKKSRELMKISKAERPTAIQIFGNDPEIMKNAAVKALSESPDVIDINLGCPAPKIIKGDSGSSLLKNPALVGKIVKNVSAAVNVPVTVKIRSGWDENSVNAPEIAKIAEENGAAAVTVHGRTKEQMYRDPVNFEIIKRVKESVSIPVIGNGGIVDALSAKKMYDETGCDLIMVGRGALGRPWIFSEIEHYLSTGEILPVPPIEKRMEIMVSHIEKLCEIYGEKNGVKIGRKHALWYTKGIRGASKFRNGLSLVSDVRELKKIAGKIILENLNI